MECRSSAKGLSAKKSRDSRFGRKQIYMSITAPQLSKERIKIENFPRMCGTFCMRRLRFLRLKAATNESTGLISAEWKSGTVFLKTAPSIAVVLKARVSSMLFFSPAIFRPANLQVLILNGAALSRASASAWI